MTSSAPPTEPLAWSSPSPERMEAGGALLPFRFGLAPAGLATAPGCGAGAAGSAPLASGRPSGRAVGVPLSLANLR